jgi:hypothetical protein
MKFRKTLIAGFALAGSLGFTAPAFAHCDTLDGPVVDAARKALDTGNTNLVLVWVQKDDEAEIRNAFQQAYQVRKAGGEAKKLADRYFFETLVRVHRAGEGAPYTGLKSAGTIEPPVAAADKAIATARPQELAKLMSTRVEKGLHGHFAEVMAKKSYDPNDVEAGRGYTAAYVEFTHYAERLYNATEPRAPGEHAH